MNMHLGLRTLALLALVAASTVAIVMPELFGASAPQSPTLNSVLIVGHP